MTRFSGKIGGRLAGGIKKKEKEVRRNRGIKEYFT